jgi:hypothetical protein
MRLMIWNKFLMGFPSNPQMTKKEICHHLDLKVVQLILFKNIINFKFSVYFKKPKAHKKKKLKKFLKFQSQRKQIKIKGK